MKISLVDAISEHVTIHAGNAYDDYDDISGSLSSRYSAAISGRRDDEFDTNTTTTAAAATRYTKSHKATSSSSLSIDVVKHNDDDEGVDDHRTMVASKSQSITNKPIGRGVAVTTKFLSSSENLRAELELLKMQNQMLTTRIQRTRDESSQQLEIERTNRLKQVSELQSENQRLASQLASANDDAQATLAKEKEHYLSMLKDMQREKDALHERIRQTSELAQHELMLVYLQKSELEERLRSLDEHRMDLEQRLSSNKLQSDRPTSGLSPNQLSIVELENERNALLDAMKLLTEEKLQLQTTWSETEEAAASNQTRLRIQLEQEQRSMAEYTKKMEQDQRDMSLHLQQAELRMKEEAAAVVKRLSIEKSEALLALEAIAEEKRQLNDLINAYTSSSPSVGIEEAVDVRTTQNTKEMKSISTAQSTRSSSVETIDQLSSMKASMENLRQQLQEKEQFIKQREQQLEEQANREKDELKRAVMKMREEVLADKEQQSKRQHEQDENHSLTAALLTTPHNKGIGDGVGPNSPSSQKSKSSTDSAQSSSSRRQSPGIKLTSNKSLFDILEGTKPLPNNAKHDSQNTTSVGGKERGSRLSAITDKRNKIDFKIRTGKPSTPSQGQQREPRLTERLSSYHKINLYKHQEIESSSTTIDAATAATEVKKKKTFMDLDSDDDNDDGGGGNRVGDGDGIDGSDTSYERNTKRSVDKMTKPDIKIFNKNESDKMHQRGGNTAEESKDVSSGVELLRNGEEGAHFTGKLGRDETGRAMFTGELFDYSSFDANSIVQGLPAPHAAAAMNDVRRY